MDDLFISYSSKDRPWAERLYSDLSTSFPSISVFWDRAGIPAAGLWRTILSAANVNTTHLAILWSNDARDSIEVGPEIATFEADVRYAPRRGASRRVEFFFALQGQRGGGIQDLQGFTDFAQYYDPAAPDRGVSKLDTVPGAITAWKRAITMIGDAIGAANDSQKVIAAVIATKTTMLPLLDLLQDRPQTLNGPTLNQFLREFGLDWPGVRGRYGATARDWRPFGGTETIVELLEAVRVQANSRLDPRYWFQWDHVDLTDPAKYGERSRLLKEPSVVIVDPISLYDTVTANTFRGLDEYVRDDQSILVSLAPVGQTGVDWLALALREQSVPLLNDYFEPRIPPLSRFARCSINVQRIDEIERYVRGRLGLLHLRAKEAEAKTITGVVR